MQLNSYHAIYGCCMSFILQLNLRFPQQRGSVLSPTDRDLHASPKGNCLVPRNSWKQKLYHRDIKYTSTCGLFFQILLMYILSNNHVWQGVHDNHFQGFFVSHARKSYFTDYLQNTHTLESRSLAKMKPKRRQHCMR